MAQALDPRNPARRTDPTTPDARERLKSYQVWDAGTRWFHWINALSVIALAVVGYLTPEGLLREVCVGTGKKNDIQHYLNRPRVTGDTHGQAPMLWSATALLR